MSAVVCGKRSNIFEESPSSPSVSKRSRWSSSPARNLSPPRPPGSTNYTYSNSALDHLIALFPDMDRQFLENALDECGDNLDSTIRRLNELRLGAAACTPGFPTEADGHFSSKGSDVGGTAHREENPARSNLPLNGTEWVELLVREVLSAPDVHAAKARLSQALENLEKAICENATAEAAKSFHKENTALKEQLVAVLQENAILKRAVSIQHERQKEFDDMGKELHQLKQLVSQYQEQVRTLEVNNYALAMHLKQDQQSSSLPGRFNPDVF